MFLVGILYYRVGILLLKLKFWGISKPILVALRYVSPSFTVLSVQNQSNMCLWSIFGEPDTLKATTLEAIYYRQENKLSDVN